MEDFKESCANCHFNDIQIVFFEDVGEQSPHNVCKRFPPQVVPTPDGAISLFPLIHDEDWCGEWAKKVRN